MKTFREVFRKITGISPLEYRNKYNKETGFDKALGKNTLSFFLGWAYKEYRYSKSDSQITHQLMLTSN